MPKWSLLDGRSRDFDMAFGLFGRHRCGTSGLSESGNAAVKGNSSQPRVYSGKVHEMPSTRVEGCEERRCGQQQQRGANYARVGDGCEEVGCRRFSF